MLARRLEEDYELYEEESIRAIPQPKKRRRPKLNTHLRSRCLLLLVLMSVMALTVTVRSGMSASRGYELVQIQQQASHLEQENERLKIDIAQLKAPQRIQSIAIQQLGMIIPPNVYFSSEKR